MDLGFGRLFFMGQKPFVHKQMSSRPHVDFGSAEGVMDPFDLDQLQFGIGPLFQMKDGHRVEDAFPVPPPSP